MVTVLNGGGWTVVIASRLAPTVGMGVVRWKVVGCQAAFASKPAPTVGLSAFSWKLVGSQAGSHKSAKAERTLFTTQMAECQLAESS
ncbi:hypothetical protein [Pseudomonas sp. MWU16-30322]|uniref:hypothetical protein n=1 Tax=Pseudomonas sp. MWU16-30322 TaxID=2878092 RepID=UPI001CF993F4|nr:hypothetical protein [Pseudomonas sp. MWU16-30322]